MAQVMSAVHLMLANRQPFPAIAIDHAWNVRLSNGPFEALVSMLGPGLWTRIGGEQRSIMRLFFHPDGIRPLVVNWAAIAPLLWQRARREADAVGGQEMQSLLEELARHLDPQALRIEEDCASRSSRSSRPSARRMM
jgi:hypothetical protein